VVRKPQESFIMFPLDVKMGQLSAAASQSMLIRFVSNKVFLPAFSLVSSLWALPRPTSFTLVKTFAFAPSMSSDVPV